MQYVQDSTLPILGKEKDIPSKKNLDLIKQFKRISENVGHYDDRSGKSEKEGTNYRNYTHNRSRRYYHHPFFSSSIYLLLLFPSLPFWVG